jgi:magnesium transporter
MAPTMQGVHEASAGANAAARAVDVLWFSSAGVERRHVGDIAFLLARDDGFLWVDIAACDAEAMVVLGEVFRFHPYAVRDCLERSRVPKVHAYSDHAFVRLHAPEPGALGNVLLLQLIQFLGPRYLVTVHEPTDAVPLETVLRETRAVLARIEGGRFRPASPAELSYAIVTAIARRMEALVWTLASRVAALEQRVMQGGRADPHGVLEEMFRLRHELLTLRTNAAQSREAYARMASLAHRFVPQEGRPFLDDLLDQFDRVRSMCNGEKEFLQGVVDFYQTRTTTKMNVAMERLALLTALVLPVIAIASIYGMNIIVSDTTHPVQVIGVLAVMGVMTLAIVAWARRQGW